MNLRILKKLSKRAARYLAKLGDKRNQFAARRERSYHGILIMDRTCWDRGRSVHGDVIGQHEIKKPAADGKGWVWMCPPSCALKGTPMVGSAVGYEEPEWVEEACLEALMNLVFAHYTDWKVMAEWDLDDGPPPRPVITRDLSTPSLIFSAADEMVAELACEAAR